jgi:thymidylate synthase
MKVYLDLVRKIVEAPESCWKGNRTGIQSKAISGYMIEHDMNDGFPLLTTKHVPFKIIAIELEFFIKGLKDKQWLKDRGCHIWDEWCNPEKVPYANDEATKVKMAAENDLGFIYGWQWRNFNGEVTHEESYTDKYNSKRVGHDQFVDVVKKLHTDKSDRRMIVSAWNPEQLHQMALPPCHLLWQVIVTGKNYDVLNLNWYQRSCDVMLGIPFNIASYALLLKLLAAEVNMKEGKLCGMLGDVHIYENQIETAKIQLEREPYSLPQLELPGFTGIFDWTYEQRKIINYKHHPKLEYSLAV